MHILVVWHLQFSLYLTFSQGLSGVQYSPAYGCVNLDIHQAEPDPEAELRRMHDDSDWERFKKMFDERNSGRSSNPEQHQGQNPG